LWFGAFVSNIGTWMETVGVGIYVTAKTGQAGWTGLAAAAGFVPQAVLAPLGGALADRIPRRTLLLTSNIIATLLAALLALLTATGSPSPGIVVLIVFVGGCVMALAFPSYQAILPDLVPEEDLVGAIALSSAQWNLGRVVGPALAGIVIASAGYGWAFGLNALSFLAVIAAIAPLQLPRPHPSTETIGRAIRTGMRFVRIDPGMRVVIAYMAVNSLLAAPFIALVPAMAIKVLDTGTSGTSILVTAQGIGAVAMALLLGALTERFGLRRVLPGVLWLLPPALVLYGLAPALAESAVAILAVGFLYLGALSTFVSVSQLRAPAEVRGRVISVLMMLLGIMYPIGSVVQGALADRIGLRATTVGAAVLMLAVLVIAKLVRPDFADALDAPVGAVPTMAAPRGG
jgi:MFS family permease